MRIFSPIMLLAGNSAHGFFECSQDGTYYFNLPRKATVKLTMVGGGACYSDVYFAFSDSFDLIHSQYGGNGGGLYIATAELPAGNYSVEIVNGYQTTSPVVYRGETYYSINSNEPYVKLSTPTGVELINIVRTTTKSDTYTVIYEKQIIQEIEGNARNNEVGGASLYNGYGKGADYGTSNQTNGYFKVEW